MTTPDQMTWHCTTCGETVTHQHRPLKPSYEELLATLKEVDTAMRGTTFEGGYVAGRVFQMLERAERGR